jgi:hypothetical protein
MGEFWRGMICLSLVIGFEEDRARLGLPAAIGEPLAMCTGHSERGCYEYDRQGRFPRTEVGAVGMWSACRTTPYLSCIKGSDHLC